ncbi:pre-rRNA processing protein Utp22 [Macrolepiota fuliginosa MF-IS2]|uniref:U3 small nucleolar RNA-associated protein 22 n=1 Tax=Macrolepiota fuliginosa MF-IS2 TaxID=1400762 RepID=A0A9P5XCD3_9AGAR|nr:pre-rRNA processing protein Utp22 [Macrolepiota fuliginosa MF-IS2]
MALNLKRKRSGQAASRKTRKVEEDELPKHPDSDQNENEDIDNDESLHGGSDGSQSGGEDEWSGIGASNTIRQERPEESSGRLNKPPTGEELRVIKDAADLFRSNSFKLQIDALLPNVRPKPSRIPPLDQFLMTLHTFILGIPPISHQHPLEAARKMLRKGVAVPYTLPLPTEETNWKVGYESPNDITLVGSWANKISVKPKDGQKYGVDLAVEMPHSLFQEKDYLNGRFFQKRAFYLAAIASAIKSSKKMKVDVFYDSPTGDPRWTNLILVPKNDESLLDFTKLNAKVVIIPTLSKTSPIPISRLSPSHSNLRLATSSNHQDAIPTPPQPRQIPSSVYNNALLHAFTPRQHLLSMHGLKHDSPAFGDAVTLLRIWANQRGFAEGGEGKLCVRGFEGRGAWWSAVVSLIVLGEEVVQGSRKSWGASGKRRALGRGLSSYQMFKAALDFLAKFEFEKEAVFVKSVNGHQFTPEEYDVQQQPVFVDSTSLTNLLSGVPRGSLELLRDEAFKTLESLNRTTISGDSFTEVFLKEHRNLPTRFDSILRVDLSDAKPRNLSLDETMDKGSPFTALILSIDKLLHKGLGDRTKAITILHPSTSLHSIDQALPPTPDTIYIGLVHHPQHATRLVDHGPAADEQDQSLLTDFRELWGEKAELRRFKDGRIVESVVWEVKTADERAHVPSLIVRFLLQRHFGISSSSSASNKEGAVRGWQSAFDSVLRLPEEVSRLYLDGSLPVGYKSALNAFDGLVKAIKALDDELPLATLNVSPISEALRYTSVFSPVSLPDSLVGVLPPNARYLPYMDIIIEFETSSKWPDDLKAIQKIKLAFFEKVAEGLIKSVQGLKARVVTGDGVHENNPVLDQSFLEVLTPEGWAFAVRIWNSREAVLLDRITAGHEKLLPHIKSLHQQKEQKGKEYHDAVYAKEVYTRRFIHAPRHHRAIAALCHRYSAYAGTVRLVKRWFAAHWVLGPGRVSEEAVELICARVFIGEDGKYVNVDVDSDVAVKQPGVPGSKERGFACVVDFLREWKWEEGMHVPLYGPSQAQGQEAVVEDESGEGNVAKKMGGNGEEKKEITASSTSVWTISTEIDMEGNMWTTNSPDAVVAHRIEALAQATWQYLQEIEKGNVNVQALFVHPTDDYDVLVQFNPSVLPRYVHNVAISPDALTKRGKYANKVLGGEDAIVRAGFDPARMLFDDLQRVYADTFRIFYDPYGGDRFGIVWDPSVKQPRAFRVLGGFSSEPVHKENDKRKDKGLVSLNQHAILSEVERLGAGLISKIVVQT